MESSGSAGSSYVHDSAGTRCSCGSTTAASDTDNCADVGASGIQTSSDGSADHISWTSCGARLGMSPSPDEPSTLPQDDVEFDQAMPDNSSATPPMNASPLPTHGVPTPIGTMPTPTTIPLIHTPDSSRPRSARGTSHGKPSPSKSPKAPGSWDPSGPI